VTESTTGERGRLIISASIKKLKEEISITTYLRARGVEVNRRRARCIVHGGDNPESFIIDTETQRWHCFSCGESGDLIDLCELVEKHADTWTAIVSLSMQFDVPLPERSASWRQRQGEKERVREAAKRRIASVYQRRLTRVYTPLVLVGGETREQELKELEGLAEALWPCCLAMADRRVSGE